MGKLSNLAADVKRKLTTGGIELVLGIGILIYSAVTKSSLYTYAGILFAGSGAFTLAICLLRIFTDKKAAQKKELKEKEQTTETSENVVEVDNVNEKQVTLQDSTATSDTTVTSDTETVTVSTTSDTSDSTDTEK